MSLYSMESTFPSLSPGDDSLSRSARLGEWQRAFLRRSSTDSVVAVDADTGIRDEKTARLEAALFVAPEAISTRTRSRLARMLPHRNWPSWLVKRALNSSSRVLLRLGRLPVAATVNPSLLNRRRATWEVQCSRGTSSATDIA